jgi:ABC-2 type transport system ATP-binding protein
MKVETVAAPTSDFDAGDIALETKRLTKTYGHITAVNELTFKVPKGCVAAFVGPNGAGKSTTLRMLLGLVYPTSGTATVLGESIDNPESYLTKVGALIEGPAFYPSLSGEANLVTLATLGGLSKRRIPEVLELVGLERRANDKVSKYSLGMKQRLGVAAAMLPEPTLLVLDEPANGLDPTGIAAMRALLRKVADEGITVLVSSHQLSDLQQVADWVIIINQGQLRYQGNLETLLERRGSLYLSTERPEDLERLGAALAKSGYAPLPAGPGRLMVKVKEGAPSRINRLAMEMGITLTELHSAQASLEDVYFTMTDGGSIA